MMHIECIERESLPLTPLISVLHDPLIAITEPLLLLMLMASHLPRQDAIKSVTDSYLKFAERLTGRSWGSRNRRCSQCWCICRERKFVNRDWTKLKAAILTRWYWMHTARYTQRDYLVQCQEPERGVAIPLRQLRSIKQER